MTHLEQLEKWVEGISIHNETTNECCPDFSCCQPELLVDQSVREAFRDAVLTGDEKTKMQMLAMFLGQSFKLLNKEAYISTGDPQTEH